MQGQNYNNKSIREIIKGHIYIKRERLEDIHVHTWGTAGIGP